MPFGAVFIGEDMEASNVPVRRARKEIGNNDFEMGQKPDIEMGDEKPVVPAIEAIHADTLVNGRLEQLAFNEEPIEVMIYPSSEENAPNVVDCWVNGKGAEVFQGGKWHVLGCLPVGVRVITRRKYAEVLLRAKRDKIQTHHEGSEVERPNNRVSRTSSAVANIQIVHDNNPKGVEWVRRLLGQPG